MGRGLSMFNSRKLNIIFIVSFIIAFFIVGYVRNTMFIAIDWVEGATIWSKFREYYIRTFFTNIIPAFIIAIVVTFIISLPNKKRNK
jgi:hypothetical protein